MSSTPAPLVLPAAAVDRINRGDVDILREGLRRGLRAETVWPGWNIPLLHGICLTCPPQAHAMVLAIQSAGHGIDTTHQGLAPALWAVAGRQEGATASEESDRLSMLDLLLDADPATLPLVAFVALRANYQEAFALAMDKGCDPNARTEKGDSLLHEAYRQKNIPAAVRLLRMGAEQDTANDLGLLAKDAVRAEDRETFHAEIQALALTSTQWPNHPAAALPRL